MKKLRILALSGLLFLSACSSNSSNTSANVEELEKKITLLEAENKELKEKLQEAEANKQPQPATNDNSNTPAPTSSTLGERRNPIPLGEKATISGEYLGEPITFTITLKDKIEGEAALEKMKKDNPYNELKKGEEITYYTVDFTLDKYAPKDDDYFWISNDSFDSFKSDYAEYKTDTSTVVENELAAKVYEGGNVSGTIAIVSNKDDKGFIVFEDFLWFHK